MDSDTARKNLKDERTWRRLVYIVLFLIAFNVVEMILWALLIVQFLSKLFSGRPIARAAEFGGQLASYAHQVVCFLTFSADHTPWPFAPWPQAASNPIAPEDPKSDEGVGSPKPPRPAPAPRQKRSRRGARVGDTDSPADG